MKFTKSLSLIALLTLSACSSAPKLEERIGKVEDLYNDGMDMMQTGEYFTAIHTFEELERQHPYSNWATRAQMMVAYAKYRMEEYDEAIEATNRFIRLHPGHKDTPYMFYIKGLSYYNRISNVTRDQGFTRDALNVFDELVRRFPDSDYAQDASLKITLCKDHLAGQEMEIGRYYQAQRRYLAALNRFQVVVKNYEKSTHAPEALYRMVEINIALGLVDEAKKNAAVLGYNFPSSNWYKNAYSLLVERELLPAGQDKKWYQKIPELVSNIVE